MKHSIAIALSFVSHMLKQLFSHINVFPKKEMAPPLFWQLHFRKADRRIVSLHPSLYILMAPPLSAFSLSKMQSSMSMRVSVELVSGVRMYSWLNVSSLSTEITEFRKLLNEQLEYRAVRRLYENAENVCEAFTLKK